MGSQSREPRASARQPWPVTAPSRPITGLLPALPAIGGLPQLGEKRFHLTLPYHTQTSTRNQCSEKTTLDLAGGRPVLGKESKSLWGTQVGGGGQKDEVVFITSTFSSLQREKALERKATECNTSIL